MAVRLDRLGFPLRAAVVVRIAHLDTGYYPTDDDYIGGAPLAEVFTYRVSPSVVLLYPLHVGEGIFSAITNHADLISMSMGGVPSYFLRDAVKTAYGRGVPMFFAAADFFRLPIPIIQIEIPPHTMVYPARFSTATPVSGMTASGRSYGLNPSLFLSVLRDEVPSWMMRGSYGPAHLMKDREVAQLLTTEPALRDVNGHFENTPSPLQLRRLARALERHPRASAYLRRAVAAGPARSY